jgi:hypothetical protein
MLVGINYPWIDYGWDFGGPPPEWVGSGKLAAWREKKRNQIDEDFGRFTAQGIFAVRWFLMADGLNYGMGEFAPRETARGWTFDPLPPEDSFYSCLFSDFEFALQVCNKNNLKLLPSLIDFPWCRQGTPVAGNPRIIKGGRYDIVRDPAKRQAFFDGILDPLLSLSMQYRDSIYAWELINEPEWVVRKSWLWWKNVKDRTVSRKEMKEFITEGLSRINARQLPEGGSAFQSSVGFAHWDSLNTWNAEDLGIALPQFHYYAQQNRALPGPSESAGLSCIVGEFATAAEKDWPDLRILNAEQTLTNRLSCIKNKGYPACFLWSARATDPATRWTEKEHQEIVAYTGAAPSGDVSV